jgi:hypothetical protein
MFMVKASRLGVKQMSSQQEIAAAAAAAQQQIYRWSVARRLVCRLHWSGGTAGRKQDEQGVF